ncbi:uncharacterized protein LOC144272373 [Eretmochelys imbricata]
MGRRSLLIREGVPSELVLLVGRSARAHGERGYIITTGTSTDFIVISGENRLSAQRRDSTGCWYLQRWGSVWLSTSFLLVIRAVIQSNHRLRLARGPLVGEFMRKWYVHHRGSSGGGCWTEEPELLSGAGDGVNSPSCVKLRHRAGPVAALIRPAVLAPSRELKVCQFTAQGGDDAEWPEGVCYKGKSAGGVEEVNLSMTLGRMQRQQIQELCTSYAPMFSATPGLTEWAYHSIDTELQDEIPASVSPYL